MEHIDLKSSVTDLETAIRQGVDTLRLGKLLVLPTETVYGLAALASDARAVERLVRVKGRSSRHPLTLALSGIDMLHDYVTELDPLAERLARRCWPGPVTLVLPITGRDSAIHLLPTEVLPLVHVDGFAGFRVPQHPITQTILGELSEPIVLSSANRSGDPDPMIVQEVMETFEREFAREIDLVLDDGPTGGGLPSTVVRVEGAKYRILRDGALKKETIARLTSRIILFVCTGNTCRSPMAEVLCEKILAERLGCGLDALEEQGYVVLSAGLATGGEHPAAAFAQQAVESKGLSLDHHLSQQLNDSLIQYADHIFTMTRAHREAILSRWPSADTRLSVLRTDGGDIDDPYGAEYAVYARCADQLETEIRKRLPMMMEETEK